MHAPSPPDPLGAARIETGRGAAMCQGVLHEDRHRPRQQRFVTGDRGSSGRGRRDGECHIRVGGVPFPDGRQDRVEPCRRRRHAVVVAGLSQHRQIAGQLHELGDGSGDARQRLTVGVAERRGWRHVDFTGRGRERGFSVVRHRRRKAGEAVRRRFPRRAHCGARGLGEDVAAAAGRANHPPAGRASSSGN